MSDKGICGDCGKESFLLDCNQEEHRYDDGCLEIDFECPYCEEGYINEFIPSTTVERTRYRISTAISRIKFKVYRRYYIARSWLDDALHPGRQRVNRARILHLIRDKVNLQDVQYTMLQHIEHLEEAVKKDMLSAVDMLARNIDVSIRELHIPYYSGIASYIGDGDGLEPVEANQVVLEKRSVLARMDILDCHELKRIKISSEESLAMYARFVADGLANVLTKFVLKELMEDLTDE